MKIRKHLNLAYEQSDLYVPMLHRVWHRFIGAKAIALALHGGAPSGHLRHGDVAAMRA
jgi:hypothetical protein